MPSDRDELLRRVYRRANQLWLTRRIVPAGVAAMLVIIGAVAVIPRLGDEGTPSVRLATGDRTDSTSTADGGVAGDTTTTAGPRGTPTTRTAGDPNQTVSTVVPPPGPTTSTTRAPGTDPCRNNNGNPDCGEFRWASNPGANAPLEFTVTHSPAQPKAGQQVTFTVRVVDPDATPINDCGSDFDGNQGGGCAHTMECALNYGAWDVPARQRGEATFTYTHTYTSPGSKTATFYAESMQGAKTNGSCAAPPNPYASYGEASKTLTVSP